MCRWFGHELAAVELALRQPQRMSSIPACFYKLNTPTDSVYGSLLRQRRESIQNLQDRWPNVLASPARYTSQARIAVQLAESLSGGSSPPELQWLDPIVLTLADECQAEEDAEDVTPQGDTVDDVFDPGTAVLQDVLAGSVPDESDEEDNDNEEPPDVHIEWRIPPVRHSTVDSDSSADVTFHFQEPIRDSFNIPINTMSVDCFLGTHVRPAQDGFPALVFETRDTNRLVSSTGLLNDVCINGCTTLLYTQFTPTPGCFSVFSTYDLH